MNRLSLIRWPGTGGGSPTGGTGVTSVGLTLPSAFSVAGSPITTAGTFVVTGAGVITQFIDGTGALQTLPVVSANDGLSLSGTTVKLGQNINQAGSPGKLLSPRELPFNGQSLSLIGLGSVAGSHLILKTDAAVGLDPQIEFQNSAGTVNGHIRFNSNGGTFFGNGAGAASTGQYCIAIGLGAMAGLTTGARNIAIGVGAMQGNGPTVNPSNCIIIGGDALDNAGSSVGDNNIIVGNNNNDSGLGAIGGANISIGNFTNNSNGGLMGDNNIFIGHASNSLGTSNSTMIGVASGVSPLTLNNVNVFGDSTKNTILGIVMASQSDSGDRLQVLGTIKVTSLPSSANPLTSVAWDTVTNKLVAGGSSTNDNSIFTVHAAYNITALDANILVDASTGSTAIGLPAPATVKGRAFNIKKIDATANSVVITPVSGLLDGAANATITVQYTSLLVKSDGVNYYIF